MADYIATGAIISTCGKYRYRLWREWRLHPTPAQWDMWTDESGNPVTDGEGHQLGDPKTCLFVMLNPSTADGNEDDPTICRCVNYAKTWGYDRMEVVNLFAFRATNPATLLALGHEDEPCGVDNQREICTAINDRVNRIVVAWGAHGAHLGQGETVLGWISDHIVSAGYDAEIVALGVTNGGQPRHPLYLRADALPFAFPATPPIKGADA